MANYLTIIDDRIAEVRVLLNELEVTRRILLTLQEPVLEAAQKRSTTMKKTRSDKGKNKRGGGQLEKARLAAVNYLERVALPQPSRAVIEALTDLGLADSTIWKALKELRDEGVLTWDTETRMHSLNPEPVQVAS